MLSTRVAWQRTRWAMRGTGETLKRRLVQIAVGCIPLPDPAAVLFDLASAIEGSRRVAGL
ncbi:MULTISPECIES: hypothetical protein [Burkholderiaceae]|uniref:hypothetical protein n=1 Tax=Burkholderiaceae TaxID=119060 RepID=UPI001115657F|nr:MULTISPECIES: hypothetical protein [Burkholderiaceae]MCF2134736.1 hypothetical protein [Mycetohabitans sp. B3]MCG1040040.1 hypothetical protein [Mycetohabitans sp. B7]